MDTKFSKPKSFGEILDHTFSISKNGFKDFFLIVLLFMGPVYLLEAIIQLVSGTSFLRATGSGNNWFEQMVSNINQTQTLDSNSVKVDIGTLAGAMVTGILGVIFSRVAEAAILLAVQHIRNNEEYTVGSLIKQAFSRFWPILGSSILFGLISFGMIIGPLSIVVMIGIVVSSLISPFIGIPLAIILLLGGAVGVGLLLTRWSFYFGSVVLDQNAPGLSRSWRLTKKRTWITMGMYIVFYLIILCISLAIESTFSAILGDSVLLTIITDITSLFTTLFFAVAYSVMFLDLKLRHDADDLKEMIKDYDTSTI